MRHQKTPSTIQMKAAAVHVWILKFARFANLGMNPLKTSPQIATELTMGLREAATGGSA